MRHHRYIVFILDGCGYGYGSRTATETVALEQPVAEVLVHVLAAVCGDIDVFRVESRNVSMFRTTFRCLYLSEGAIFQKKKLFFRYCLSDRLLSFLFRCLCLIGKILHNPAHWEQKYEKEMRNAFLAGYSFMQRMENAL